MIGILFSGGMDSSVLLYSVLNKNPLEEVKLFLFNYGSVHNKKEREHAMILIDKVMKDFPLSKINTHFINIPFKDYGIESDLLKTSKDIPDGHYEDKSMEKTVVPFRNGIMLSIACAVLNEGKLLYGAHFGDHAIYPDCREDFILSMKEVISKGTDGKVILETPFSSINKRDIALLNNSLQIKAPIELSWSCYKGKEKHCGVCGTCNERKEALQGFDLTEYEV